MKRILTIILLAILCGNAMAYDFSAECSSGQTLYYNITSATSPYAVEVTYQREATSSNNYTSYSTCPTGNLTIPSSVIYSGTTYSVTSIGTSAFSGCSDLTSVTITNSVTNIGENAFYNCSGLTEITIPESIICIDGYAFCNCSGLNTVNFNAMNCTTMGFDGDICHVVFSSCTSLTTLNVGDNVTNIPDWAFINCDNLTTVNFNAVNCNPFGSHNGISGNTNITTLTIGENVTNIPAGAFSGCSGLTSVTIPSSVTSIGENAFYNCSGLTSATIGNSVTSIGIYAFYNCSGLTSLTIGNSVEIIDQSVFWGCSGLTEVTIPNSVTSIGASAFRDCSRLTSITIGSGLTSIGCWAFRDCSGLTTVNFNATNCTSVQLNSNGEPFYGCNSQATLNIGENVTNIPGFAFKNWSGLASATIPNSVTSIADGAFSGCSSLTAVNFNATNCTTMGSYSSPVFDGCTSLATLNIGENVTNIPGYAFMNCSGLVSATIPHSVTSIGNSAFSGCSGLAAVYYTGTIAEWCEITFSDYNSNPLYYAHKLYIDNSLVADLIVPESISEIKPDAFSGANCLTSVTLPSSLTEIGYDAFYGCYSISVLKVYANTPPVMDYYTFSETTYSTATVWVPCIAESSYKNDYYWGQFADIRSYNPNSYYIDTTVNNYIQIEGHTFYASGVYEFEMESDDEECPPKIILNLTVLNGVDEYAADSICIFPNPANNILNINSNGFISTVELYSTTGQLVMRKEITDYEAELDIDRLVDGVYVLRIYGDGNSLPSAYKIVKE
ncbi:MAG: leucine-rich repeat domain-containing protein [Bacteroidales bacterium]|nr:leucine-rich repeat domain-containing protein [Bacteroidales bacterium]